MLVLFSIVASSVFTLVFITPVEEGCGNGPKDQEESR